MATTSGVPEGGDEQPFVSHLLELRDRLLRMLVAVALAFAALFPFSNTIYTTVAKPLMSRLPAGASMIATEVTSPFLTPFKLTLIVAVFLAMPYVLYQFWGFVAPGLYRHERRLVLPLVFSSVMLFYVGMAFAYFVVFPMVFAFFVHTAPAGVEVMTDISHYLDFVLRLFFAFGVGFEVPIATILLVWMGVVDRESIAKQRPYVIVGAFILGMLLTPPDVISQTLLAVPMWGLFELGLFFSRFFVRSEGEEETEETAAAVASVAPARAAVPPEPMPPTGFQLPSDGAGDPGRDRIEPEDAPEGGHEHSGEESAAERLERAAKLCGRGEDGLARSLLYEVLVEGDDEQVAAARNLLNQLDGGV